MTITVRGKRARLRAEGDRAERLRQVAKLRFVQCWTNDEIASALSVCRRQIERDVALIREKLRDDAESNLKHEIRDIAEEMKLRHEETVKLLWNDYTRTAKEAEELAKEIKLLRGELIDVGEKTEAALINATRKEELLAQALSRGDRILWQITETDSSFVDQIRKLGLVKNLIDAEGDGDTFFLEIRARRKEIEKIRGRKATDPESTDQAKD